MRIKIEIRKKTRATFKTLIYLQNTNKFSNSFFLNCEQCLNRKENFETPFFGKHAQIKKSEHVISIINIDTHRTEKQVFFFRYKHYTMEGRKYISC